VAALSVAASAASAAGVARASEAPGITGVISDATGAPLSSAKIVLRDLATGQEISSESNAQGRYQIDTKTPGTYLLIVSRQGFAEVARTIVITSSEQRLEFPVKLELGSLATEVTVTAARSAREVRQIPLNVDTKSKEQIEQTNPLSTGTAIAESANVTPVGDGPFGVRPRLRGLDSTRLLVLVDGERLNTARLATNRAGAEAGLVATDSVERIEIVNGAGTLMYGSDALGGTINILTNTPKFANKQKAFYGFNGFYSSNENGRRGTLTFGTEGPRVSLRVQGGVEQFDSYTAGKIGVEDTNKFFTSGQIKRTDTIDTNFGFAFKAFPDPFNAPYVRTDAFVPNSGAKANFVSAAALVKLADRQTLNLRYQQRRATDVGFPDFASPYFFNGVSLPKSNLDRFSARYEYQAVNSWLRNVSVSTHVQRTERLLSNTMPVQFPAPAATFFPISVFRLDILSETTQKVTTPGVDVQAVFAPAQNHIVTTGLTIYRDNSSDERTTTTAMSMVGQVVMGSRGPAASVFPTPVAMGPATVAHPVRVPNAWLRDIGVFAQDEWRIANNLSMIAGLRTDFYVVTNEATAGYDVTSVIAGAKPAIDAGTLPNPAGASYSRNSLTGDIGFIANQGGKINPFIRFGRSFRHPNLEELFFAGPATAGSIVPNVNVKPETGNNFDVGVKFLAGRVSGGVYGFVNQYKNFIAQDQVVATNSSGPLTQTTNFSDVRIGGVEANAMAPMIFRPGVLTLTGSVAYTRGTVLKGTDPSTGASLVNTPADDITPFKVVGSARFTDVHSRFWMEYGVRSQAKVNRVAATFLSSPFLIPQDLMSLDAITVQRAAAGINLTQGAHHARLTFAVENLANKYYREHFQFAPSRGRTFTLGLSIGAF
jgi:outer membrane receptor protein involved in Fe transport